MPCPSHRLVVVLLLLYRRCTRNQIEDYMLVLAQFIQALSMSVVVGMIYFRLEKDQQTVRDWFGLMYIIGAMYPYLVILDLIAVCKFTSLSVNSQRCLYVHIAVCKFAESLMYIGKQYIAVRKFTPL